MLLLLGTVRWPAAEYATYINVAAFIEAMAISHCGVVTA